TASARAGPQTPHGRISVIEIITARPNGARLSIIGSAAKVSSAAAVSPGITAAATGTGRPPTTGNQRGNTSPQGRIRPRVRITPSQAPPEMASPHRRRDGSASATEPPSNGQGGSQAKRIRAEGSGPQA